MGMQQSDGFRWKPGRVIMTSFQVHTLEEVVHNINSSDTSTLEDVLPAAVSEQYTWPNAPPNVSGAQDTSASNQKYAGEKDELTNALDRVSWGCFMITLGIAAYHLLHGEFGSFWSALTSAISSAASLIKEHRKKRYK